MRNQISADRASDVDRRLRKGLASQCLARWRPSRSELGALWTESQCQESAENGGSFRGRRWRKHQGRPLDLDLAADVVPDDVPQLPLARHDLELVGRVGVVLLGRVHHPQVSLAPDGDVDGEDLVLGVLLEGGEGVPSDVPGNDQGRIQSLCRSGAFWAPVRLPGIGRPCLPM